MPLVLPFPDIDPVLVSFRLFGIELAIRWYALAYIAGLLLGWRYVAALCRRPALWGGTAPMRPEQADDLLTWMILGVILGGRLGYVLFYQPAYFAANPGEILAVWQGGMSFHGGLLGVAAGVDRLQPEERARDPRRRRRGGGGGADRALLRADRQLHQRRALGPAVDRALGGGLPRRGGADLPGRLGRALRPASVAALRGGARGAACSSPSSRSRSARGALARPGRVFGLFLVGYGLARIVVERFRQADAQFVTAGQPARPRAAARRRLGPDHGPAPVAADAGGGRDPASSRAARRA